MVSRAISPACDRAKHLTMSLPDLVGIIATFIRYIAEGLTYCRGVPGRQILQKDPTYKSFPSLRPLVNILDSGLRKGC